METKTGFCQFVDKWRLSTGKPGKQGGRKGDSRATLLKTLLIMWKTPQEKSEKNPIIFALCKPIFRHHYKRKKEQPCCSFFIWG
jgi:hypothetical protein